MALELLPAAAPLGTRLASTDKGTISAQHQRSCLPPPKARISENLSLRLQCWNNAYSMSQDTGNT